MMHNPQADFDSIKKMHPKKPKVRHQFCDLQWLEKCRSRIKVTIQVITMKPTTNDQLALVNKKKKIGIISP